jgi:glycosyltransferase involved in cell wall biosynthesis
MGENAINQNFMSVLSIIIPCYNHGQYLKEALQSILACDAILYEVIIVDDGSTDAYTSQVLNELKKQGYNVIQQPNQGVAAARNNGIRNAKGKYILPLDSDNRIRPDYVYEGVKILDNNPEISVVYGNAEYFGEKKGEWVTGPFNLQRLMLRNYIDTCSIFRKSMWEELGGFDTSKTIMSCEDWDFWLRAALARYGFYYVNKVLFEYRVSSNSLSNSNNAERLVAIVKYMEEKHKSYLNRKYIEELLVENFKKNKKLFFKLFLRAFFPSLLHFLIKKKKVANERLL